MVGERNGNAIVVDSLFFGADFQVGEGEDRLWRLIGDY